MGAAAPIQAISIQSQTMPGMTVDASDDLYVADSGRQDVEEFSNAVTDPTFVRTLESAYTFEVQSLANDASGNLFVYLTPGAGHARAPRSTSFHHPLSETAHQRVPSCSGAWGITAEFHRRRGAVYFYAATRWGAWTFIRRWQTEPDPTFPSRYRMSQRLRSALS